MKVMHLITGLGTGGAEQQLLNILPHLQGNHVLVSLTDENSIGTHIEQTGIPVHYLHYKGYNLFSVIMRFRALVKKEQPTILNTYLIHADLFGRFFGKMFGIPTIICSVRNKLWKRTFLLFLDKLTSFLVDIYTPNSPAVRDFLIHEKKLPSQKMIVIPNGVDVARFEKKQDVSLSKALSLGKKPVITCVASFKAQKDHATLLKACAALSTPYTLLLVGEGKERKAMEHLVNQLGITENVHFLGRRNDIPALLSLTDIFVLPSKHEGMSNALLEAMASSCAIVATNIPENSTLVTNTREALLFAPGDVEQLTRHFETLLQDQRKRKELGKAAHHKVAKTYSFDKVIYTLNSLYKDLNSKRKT